MVVFVTIVLILYLTLKCAPAITCPATGSNTSKHCFSCNSRAAAAAATTSAAAAAAKTAAAE